VNAAEFNALYPIGTPVVAYPGCRPEDDANDERLVTFTRSKAEVLGGHTDVVWVDGHGACIALTHIDVRADDDAPVGITNPALAARIAATGVPLSADWAPQPATPRWHQLRTELIRMLRPYMPETAATEAVDQLDRLLVEVGVPAATAEWGVRLIDGGYTAASRDREQALENLAGLDAHGQAAVLVTRTVYRSAWTEAAS
jgi:hypothetical protein